MNPNRDKLESIRKWVYTEDRKFSELTRDHVGYLKTEFKHLKIPVDVVHLDKLTILKIMMKQQELINKLHEEKESHTEDADENQMPMFNTVDASEITEDIQNKI